MYANITDVSTRLGRTISDAAEVAQVNAWISDVESMIHTRIPGFADLVGADAVPLSEAKRVVCNAVLRKIKNPDGKKDESLPGEYSFGLNPEAARGELFLTDEEWADITPMSSTGAFTIRPGATPA